MSALSRYLPSKSAALQWFPLLAVTLFFLHQVIRADKPWENGIAAAKTAGDPIRIDNYIVSGLWWGALINVALCLGALALFHWLKRPLPTSWHTLNHPPLPRLWHWLPWLAITIIATIVATTQFNRLDQSLWDDEEKALRNFIVGRYYEHSQTGEIRYREVTWAEAAFGYRWPTNHWLFSLTSKATHNNANIHFADPTQPYFSERTLRMPAFIAGLAALFSITFLLHSLGFIRAAIAACLILALHPLYLRYLVEARGYALVLAFTPMVLAFFVHALRNGHMRWWLAAGFTQALLFYSYPGSLHFLLWTNTAIFTAIFLRTHSRQERLILLGRWLLSGLVFALPIIYLVAPCVPQFLEYLAENRDHPNLNAAVLIKTLSQLFSGTDWTHWDPENPHSFGLHLLNPFLLWTFITACAATLVAGIIHLHKQGFSWILLPLLLPPASLISQAWMSEMPFYPWYVIGAVPGILALMAIGISNLLPSTKQQRLTKHINSFTRHTSFPLLTTLFIILFFFTTKPQRTLITSHPIEPKRDAVRIYRPNILDPSHPRIHDVLSVGFHQENLTYNPGLIRLNDRSNQDAILNVISEAQSTGKPLFIDYAQDAYARAHFQRFFEIIDQPGQFKKIATLHGLEPQNTRIILRYHGEGMTPSPD